MAGELQSCAPDQVGLHYDNLDLFYRQTLGDHMHHGLWQAGSEGFDQARRQMVHFVARQAALRPGECLCDIGCGYGGPARELAVAFGAQVTGMTISQRQFEYSTLLPPAGPLAPCILLGDWLENTLPSGMFHAAVALESMEHMPSLDDFFSQAHRVLQPGGRLVVCTWHAMEATSKLGRRWLLEPLAREGRMRSLSSRQQILSAAAAKGFALLEFHDLSRQVAPTWTHLAGHFIRKLITSPGCMAPILFSRSQPWRFGFTVVRIILAFRMGILRYGAFTFVRGVLRAEVPGD